jgi:Sulfotransferase domain
VPEDNLLEYRPQDGWEPLCKFLGKPVPAEPYPFINKGDSAYQLHVKIFWIVVARLFIRNIAPILLAAWALWYLQGRYM